MKIPNANQFENSFEKLPNLDFLNENLKLTFSFDQEAADNLPKIEAEDFTTVKEKYRILLGQVERLETNRAHIKINGILEADENEKDLFYTENEGYVSPNLKAIKKWVKSIQNENPEVSDWQLVGDIHTHPIKANELNEESNPCNLSKNDFEDMINQYKNGTLSKDDPFIFSVAGQVDGKMYYSFYRIIIKNDDYAVEALENRV